MNYTLIDNIPVWGQPLDSAVEQIKNCMRSPSIVGSALMADHHVGYAVPVGGVVVYRGAISPSAVGADIACGNKAVLTDAKGSDVRPYIRKIMDDVWSTISFGVGRKNQEEVEHWIFDSFVWEIPAVKPLKDMAREQLGTVGSGNHYVDIFVDEQDRVWIGVHFGSRGLGHKIATHYIKEGGGKDGINVDPVVLSLTNSKGGTSNSLGYEYLSAMRLAGDYAYAGRDWVCNRVAQILGAKVLEEIHNHHNYCWIEKHNGEHVSVIRKGATPCFPGQRGFVGGTMGENSVILEGVDSPEAELAYYSTVHGAGRVMSRTEAAGKVKWVDGQRKRVSEGKISQSMMDEWVKGKAKVELRGGGLDESPHAYKRLDEVLAYHSNTVKILHTLTPIGVAMAGEGEIDPYKD